MQTALAIAIVGAVALAAIVHWRKRRGVARYVQGREPLSDSEFAALFASVTQGQVGLGIRQLLKGWVPVDVSLIRPDDEFSGDLLLDALDGLDPEEFLRTVEAKWSVNIPGSVAAELRTVRQLSAEVVRRMDEK